MPSHNSLISHVHPQNMRSLHPGIKDTEYLSEAIPAALWIIYADGRTEFCNDYWARYTGLNSGESKVLAWAQSIHPEDMEMCRTRWAWAVERGEPFEAQLRFQRGIDGQYRHHLCRATPKVDRNRQTVCWFGSTVDIEEQVQLAQLYAGVSPEHAKELREEKLLRGSEKSPQIGLDKIPGVIYQFEMKPDGSTRFSYVSAGSRSLFGIDPQEVEKDATVFLSMVAPECQPAFYTSISESARTLTRWVWEGWASGPNCPRKWIACSSMPVLKPNGSIVWDGLLMDATTQKLAQIQVEIQRLQLEEANLRLSELNKKLDDLATLDGLTGLKNRRKLQEYMVEEFQRHDRFEAPLSLMMLDVDKFKTYNDTFGHLAGDEVLRTMARILKDSMREVDFIARYGGEEFVLVLPRTGKEAAQMLAERVRKAVECYPWVERPVTTSVGVTTLPKTVGKTPEKLIEAADLALYESKNRGRNTVTYNPCFDGYIGNG